MRRDDSRARKSQARLLDNYDAMLKRRHCNWQAVRPFRKCLGIGGQGVVYLSERCGVDGFSIPVALKVFSPEQFSDEY